MPIESIIDALPFGDAEKKRLRSIKNPEARNLSLAALVSLNSQVRCFAKDLDLTIERSESRKPYFSKNPLFFSLSHTSRLAVSALCDSPVGIDLEWIDTEREIERISSRFFSSNEQSKINSANDKFLSFYSLWTKKEAFAKRCGNGLASVCSSELPINEIFYQYILELDGRKAILSICLQENDEPIISAGDLPIKIYKVGDYSI